VNASCNYDINKRYTHTYTQQEQGQGKLATPTYTCARKLARGAVCEDENITTTISVKLNQTWPAMKYNMK